VRATFTDLDGGVRNKRTEKGARISTFTWGRGIWDPAEKI